MAGQKKQRTEMSFLYDSTHDSERIFAELSSRPLRIAFLIYENIDKLQFYLLIQYISIIWGGYHCCLIPTDGLSITKEWWGVLSTYNPDKIVIYRNKQSEKLNKILLESIAYKIQPYSIIEWTDIQIDAILKRHLQGRTDLLQSIPLLPIIQNKLESLKSQPDEKRSDLKIPVISEDNFYYFLIATQIGVPVGFYQDLYKNRLKAGDVEFLSNDVDDYLEHLSLFFNVFSPINFSSIGMELKFKSLFTSELPIGLTIILIGDNWVRDICQYWNFHLGVKFSVSRSIPILLPYNIFRSTSQVSKLISTLLDASWCPKQVVLLSQSVSTKKLRHLKNRLSNLFNGTKKVDLAKFQNIADFTLSYSAIGDSTLVENDKLVFRTPPLNFNNFFEDGEWVVDINLHSPYEFPVFSKLNYYLSGSPSVDRIESKLGSWIRYGGYQTISAKVNKKTNFPIIHLVKPYLAYEALLKDKGYTTEVNGIHSYTEAFLNFLHTTDLLEKKEIRDLFWSMLSDRVNPEKDASSIALSYNDIKAKLKLGDESDEIIKDLVLKRVLLRGIELRCAYCGINRWYPINSIDEIMQCAGCLHMLQLPVEPFIKYVLNELAITAVKAGATSVLLTKHVLDLLTPGLKLSAFGLKIKKGNIDTDIDLITTHCGYPVICECKEYKSCIPKKEKGKAIKQIRGLMNVAKDIGSEFVVLSSFLPEDGQDFINLVDTLYHL